MTRQSIGFPIALAGPGELEGEGERTRAASPDPGRAVGNPIGCRVCAFTLGTDRPSPSACASADPRYILVVRCGLPYDLQASQETSEGLQSDDLS